MPLRDRRLISRLTSRLPAIAGLFPISCLGALHWDSLQVKETAWAGDKSAVAIYRFENAGNAPVTITSVKSSCGCTTVELSKAKLAAGEAGELKATMELGDRVGQQAKLITVISDDAPSRPTTLVLEVDIQEFATAKPKFVYWRVGETPAEKPVEILAHEGQRIGGIEIAEAIPGIASRIEPNEAGKAYTLWLNPSSTDRPRVEKVRCRVRIMGRDQFLMDIFVGVLK